MAGVIPNCKVEVLLSSYNGEKYIREQVDSILAQTYKNLLIRVRDDGSNDGTCEILRKYQSTYPERIDFVEDGKGNLGCAKSFMALLAESTADYVMFADQDDAWLPFKVELTLSRMLLLEQSLGSGHSILVFTDLVLVDEQLETINNSFWHSQKYDISIVSDWRKLFARNVVTGCTAMLNRAGVDVSLPFPGLDILHDQWVAISVARSGLVVPVEKSTVLYRQHSSNVEGAKPIGLFYLFGRLKFRYLKKNIALLLFLSKGVGIGVSLIFFKVWINLKRLF